jgi:DNA-binding transcriptional regulator YbjK
MYIYIYLCVCAVQEIVFLIEHWKNPKQTRHNAVADILTDNTKEIFVETDTRHVFFAELTCNLLRTLR